jgi:hypothetical protein
MPFFSLCFCFVVFCFLFFAFCFSFCSLVCRFYFFLKAKKNGSPEKTETKTNRKQRQQTNKKLTSDRSGLLPPVLLTAPLQIKPRSVKGMIAKTAQPAGHVGRHPVVFVLCLSVLNRPGA